MAQAMESRVSSGVVQPNVQDLFLNQLRRGGVEVAIYLMDGRQLVARIRSFDKFAIVVDGESGDHLIFKHAIASIEIAQAVVDDLPSQ